MIPGDIAARLRTVLETSVQALAATPRIPADLPAYEAGQRLAARILESRESGGTRALVDGAILSLALPQPVKEGDLLELIVTGQRGATVFARLVDGNPTSASTPPSPSLSQTGRMIGQLLSGHHGELTSLPMGSGPVLSRSAPKSSLEFMHALQQVVGRSGLFYEAHLREWVQGNLPLQSVLEEPQGQLSSQLASAAASQQAMAENKQAPRASPAARDSAPAVAERAGGDKPPSDPSGTSPAKSATSAAQGAGGQTTDTPWRIPETLLPLVHQQLETLATQQMNWQGQIWEGTNIHWEVSGDEGRSSADGAETSVPAWRSKLCLDLPRLGTVEAQLVLDGNGLRLWIDADNTQASAQLKKAQGELVTAMESAGVAPATITVAGHAGA